MGSEALMEQVKDAGGRGPFEPFARTTSLCPDCLQCVPARYVEHADGVYFEKTCPDHGAFSTIIWRGRAESYAAWLADAGPRPAACPSGPHAPGGRGCPYDCGLCGAHLAETCSAALMVTDRCNLNCRFCFTRSCAADVRPDPDLDELRRRLEFYLGTCGGPFPLELCGGEPTVRDDLPQIAAMAHDMGFHHIQLNSNGLRLGEDAQLAHRLKEAGVTVVYLGFDGVCDEPYAHLRDAALREAKERAVRNCGDAGLAVVLVPTLVPGVNDGALGEVIRRAVEWMPIVKGVNVQPAGYLGEYRGHPEDATRLTIPDVVGAIVAQSDGLMHEDDFMPPACEHPLCSFQALYVKDAHGSLKPLSHRAPRADNAGAAARNRAIAAKQWANGPFSTLTMGGMLIQDVWTYDVARARRCPMHVIGAEGALYPLCTKYLTSRTGDRLYPGIC